MTNELARRIALGHGIAAWFAAVLLATLAVVLVRRKLRLTRAYITLVVLAMGLTFATGVTGALLDLPYRSHLRQRIFLASHFLGWLFERKLHFAFGALVFAAIALVTLLAGRTTPNDVAQPRLSAVTSVAFVASAFFALAACVLSSVVAFRLRF